MLASSVLLSLQTRRELKVSQHLTSERSYLNARFPRLGFAPAGNHGSFSQRCQDNDMFC